MNDALIMAIAAATALATMVGGLAALGLRNRIALVLGFSAGAVLGVAFFDLMPEALQLGQSSVGATGIFTATAVGFFVYGLLDRFVSGHHGRASAPDARRGLLGAGSFSFHSMLDGFGIGVAFQASHAVGLVVASAVLAHDFADGLNTVNVVVKNGGDRSQALRWLIADALAPVLGAFISLFVVLPGGALALVLGAFAGFFLYIGAVDLLPESQRGGARLWNGFATLLGAGLLYAVTRLAG